MNITSPYLALAYVLADMAFVGRQPRPSRPRHPAPLVRLRVLHEQLDAGLRGAPMSCRPGCAACCSMVFAVADVEAERVVCRVAEQGREALEAVAARCQHSLEHLEEHFDLQLPCPLLTNDRRCSVYEERPSPCRMHMVVSPPELCSPPTHLVQTVVRHGVAHAFQMALVDDNLVGPGEVDLLPRLLLGKIRERLAREDEAVAGRESTAVAGRRRSLMENQHG